MSIQTTDILPVLRQVLELGYFIQVERSNGVTAMRAFRWGSPGDRYVARVNGDSLDADYQAACILAQLIGRQG